MLDIAISGDIVMSSDVLFAEVAFAFNRSGSVCRTAGETQKDVSDVDIKVRSHHPSHDNKECNLLLLQPIGAVLSSTQG